MFNKKINGINVIHYNPSPLEQIQNSLKALEIKKRLQQELSKPVSKKGVQKAYKEFLEVSERYDLSKRDLNY
jgi:pyruvate/2-oxoacid:ferredoxin oxidoreductase alpha subunit